MRIAITGGTGLVGRVCVKEAKVSGDEIHLLTRPNYSLGDRPNLTGCDALIHCAFQHAPGRYRGGEGDDPAGFVHANLDGSIALFEAAKASGVTRTVFLSSRAVYGDYPAGTDLSEDMAPRPDTLYGQVKWQAEQALDAMTGGGFSGASVRATGVFGPGQRHKWTDLFDQFQAGQSIAPRRSTEVHGADLFEAIRLLLASELTGAFNVSDFILDRHDLLGQVAQLTGKPHLPPAPSADPVSVMRCDRLRALGWRPKGAKRLAQELPQFFGPDKQDI